jgi:hypothetical protein
VPAPASTAHTNSDTSWFTESRSEASRKSRHKRTNSQQNSYLSAIKTASARGWRRIEPVPLGQPEQPTKLLDYLASPDSATARTVLPLEILEGIQSASTTR